MKHVIRLAAVGAAVLALAACKVSTTTSVYLSDVQKVVDSGQALDTPAVLHISMASSSTCEDQGGQVAEILRPHFDNFANPRCEGNAMESRLVADFTAPLVGGDAAPSGPVSLETEKMEDGTRLFVTLDNRKIDGIVSQAQRQGIPIGSDLDLSLSVQVNNDLGDVAGVRTTGVYASGRPLAYPETLNLSHRKAVTLKLADVKIAYAREAGQVFVADVVAASE